MFSLSVLQYPRMDPLMLRWQGFGVSWYAMMYVIGFVAAYLILRHRMGRGSFRLPQKSELSLLLVYCFYGVILGARFFYVLFYNLPYFLQFPWEIPAVWHGGMSFHGGMVGLLIGVTFFSRRTGVPIFHILDNLCLCAPVGLGFGRIGNFINGELYGRITDVPWGMVFPDGGAAPRHPSQLYESFLEGPLLFFIVWLSLRQKAPDGFSSAIFLLTYGGLRFLEEFFREPDAQLGTVLGPFSMGQVLCLAMFFSGIALLVMLKINGKKS